MNAPREPGRMLIVDDNRVNRLLLTHALEQNGHRVSTAENGKIAMEMLRGKSYDVILLDIDMPVMNGFEVLEALLSDNELRDLPVVMTSASDELDRVVKCIEMGAEDYLVRLKACRRIWRDCEQSRGLPAARGLPSTPGKAGLDGAA